MASWFGGKKKEQPQMQAPPQVAPSTEDPEKIKRIGRNALIATSERGVLGNPTTSRKVLSY